MWHLQGNLIPTLGKLTFVVVCKSKLFMPPKMVLIPVCDPVIPAPDFHGKPCSNLLLKSSYFTAQCLQLCSLGRRQHRFARMDNCTRILQWMQLTSPALSLYQHFRNNLLFLSVCTHKGFPFFFLFLNKTQHNILSISWCLNWKPKAG